MLLRLFLLSSLLLSACSQSDKTGQVLRLQLVADPVELKAYQTLIKAYEEQNPEEKINIEVVASQRDHVTKLTTGFAAGSAPDLFLINYRRYGQFVHKNLMRPLGPILEEQYQLDSAAFFPQALEAFQHQGQQLCMPQNISSLVVYWNRSLFKQMRVPAPTADWTWKEFHDAAKALTKDLDGDRKPDLFGLDVDPSVVRLAPFVWQAGGRIVDNTQNPQRFAWKDPASLQGLMFLKRLKVELAVMPPLAQRRALGPDARFIQGKLGMTLQSRRYTATLRSVEGLDWDVAPLPKHRHEASVLHADAYCLSAGSQKSDAAARFVNFALSEAGQSILSASGRIVPSRQAVANSPAFLDKTQKPESAQVFLDAVPHLRRLPVTKNWYEIETRLHPVIEEWMYEDNPNASRELRMGYTDGVRLVVMMEEAVKGLLSE